jgi:hypothetical protein
LFYVSHQLLGRDLEAVELAHSIELRAEPKPRQPSQTDPLYLQFGADVRAEAAAMAHHYELFYCLENFLRELVSGALFAQHGDDWWAMAVPEAVRENVQKNLTREKEAGVTLRSSDLIDYSTFGELGAIIQSNWDSFSDTFSDKKALSKVLTGLNLLRGPIAHCSPLSEDEVVRLGLALRDLFRLMG